MTTQQPVGPLSRHGASAENDGRRRTTPCSEEAISLRAVGPDGLVQFGEASAAATDVELTDFESDPVMLSFDLACG